MLPNSQLLNSFLNKLGTLLDTYFLDFSPYINS